MKFLFSGFRFPRSLARGPLLQVAKLRRRLCREALDGSMANLLNSCCIEVRPEIFPSYLHFDFLQELEALNIELNVAPFPLVA